LNDTGSLRFNGRKQELPAIDALESHVIDPSDTQSTTAVLDKISGAVLIGARQRQARSQLLAAFVEQLLVDSKRDRDADAGRDEHAACHLARSSGGERSIRGWHGRRLEDLAATVDTHSEQAMQLNLLPTVQQAITNLLTVYEPEFLRFGYGLFLSFATILIVWQGVR
jgi:hypothetical protein